MFLKTVSAGWSSRNSGGAVCRAAPLPYKNAAANESKTLALIAGET
jgi:hypothetical protein